MKDRRLTFDDLPLEVSTLVAMAMVDGRQIGAEAIHGKFQQVIDELVGQKDKYDFDKMCTAIGMALVEHVFMTVSGN